MHGLGHHGGHCGGLRAARRFGRHQGEGPGGWGRGGRGGGGDWFRVGRMLAQGDLKLLALALIAEQPRHGYDLIREIEERTGGQYAPSPGVIYPTLTMLQDMGLIAEENAAGTRKVYAATAEGKAHLAENKEEVTALLARIAELASAQRGDRAPVRRALRNLHAALAEKVSRSDSDELMHKIAALLDEVTQKIERS